MIWKLFALERIEHLPDHLLPFFVKWSHGGHLNSQGGWIPDLTTQCVEPNPGPDWEAFENAWFQRFSGQNDEVRTKARDYWKKFENIIGDTVFTNTQTIEKDLLAPHSGLKESCERGGLSNGICAIILEVVQDLNAQAEKERRTRRVPSLSQHAPDVEDFFQAVDQLSGVMDKFSLYSRVINVEFRVSCQTQMGQWVYLVGYHPQLGDGLNFGALKMDPKNYPIWSLSIDLKAYETIFYWYFVATEDRSIICGEHAGSRKITVDNHRINDTFGEIPEQLLADRDRELGVEQLLSLYDWKSLSNLQFVETTIGQFIVDSKHPFAESINQAKIPPAFGSKTSPDLLLHNLRGTCNRAPTKQTENLIREAEKVKEADKGIVLMGPSGCAKTRTCCEVLSQRFGMYFTVGNGKNGESSDLMTMATYLDENLPRTEGVKYAALHCHALLLSRLLVLRKLLFHGNGLVPYCWLLLQVRAREFFKIEGSDLFCKLYQLLACCSHSLISNWLQLTFLEIYHAIGILPVFVDEAQKLLVMCGNVFQSSKPGLFRPLLTQLIHIWGRIVGTVIIISGTGLGIGAALESLGSTILKPGEEMSNVMVLKFEGYQELSSFSTYISTFLKGISKEQFQELFSLFRGRARFAAYFVGQVMSETQITNRTSLLHVVQERILKKQSMDISDPSTLVSQIAQLKKITTFPGVSISPLEYLKKMVLAYYLFGPDYVFYSDQAINMMDYGVCGLQKRSNESLAASISEPLVQYVCGVYFSWEEKGLENHLLPMLADLRFSPQSSGVLLERLLIPKIIKYFRRAKRIVELPIYQQFLTEMTQTKKQKTVNEDTEIDIMGSQSPNEISPSPIPEWFYNFSLQTLPPPEARLLSSDITIEEFLQDTEGKNAYLPSFPVRKDAILKGFDCLDPRIKRLVNVEIKFHNHMNIETVQQATQSTAIDAIFTTKIGEERFGNRRKQILQLIEKLYHSSAGCLRIIFLFPALKDPWYHPHVDGQDVVLYVDGHYCGDLLELSEYQFLSSLKPEAEVEWNGIMG
eukprot:TRINITY_DN5396_c0_g1_i1.p1 TRINITY_DN5396_c0_g1~~TRINITY_DN5396_c0_g1_i1.p1  ORF type:complete len:1034 (-),score=100.41 TRINITY_DN5396_c0_g1_i1:40-3141(-)